MQTRSFSDTYRQKASQHTMRSHSFCSRISKHTAKSSIPVTAYGGEEFYLMTTNSPHAIARIQHQSYQGYHANSLESSLGSRSCRSSLTVVVQHTYHLHTVLITTNRINN